MRALYTFALETERGKEGREPPRVSVVLPAIPMVTGSSA